MDTLRVERWNLLSEWENILRCGKKRETDIHCQIYIIVLSIKQYYNISDYYIVYGLQERCFEFNYATLYKEWQKRSGEHVLKVFILYVSRRVWLSRTPMSLTLATVV